MLEKSRGISRRAVATGALWSVPLVGVVANTPAFAVSPEPQITARTYLTYDFGKKPETSPAWVDQQLELQTNFINVENLPASALAVTNMTVKYTIMGRAAETSPGPGVLDLQSAGKPGGTKDEHVNSSGASWNAGSDTLLSDDQGPVQLIPDATTHEMWRTASATNIVDYSDTRFIVNKAWTFTFEATGAGIPALTTNPATGKKELILWAGVPNKNTTKPAAPPMLSVLYNDVLAPTTNVQRIVSVITEVTATYTRQNMPDATVTRLGFIEILTHGGND